MSLASGICIHRRSAAVAVLDVDRGRNRILFEHAVERPAGSAPAEALGALLAVLPAEHRQVPLHLALSGSDLSCADAWEPAPEIGRPSPGLASALCEARCAGEPLEDLHVATRFEPPVLQAVALLRKDFAQLLRASEGFRLSVVTSVPAVLAAAFGEGVYPAGGEVIDIRRVGQACAWRARPMEEGSPAGSFRWRDLDVSPASAGAVAAAVADPDAVPNLVDVSTDTRAGLLRKFRDPLVNVAAAVALCLLAVGVRLHRSLAAERAEFDTVRQTEIALWQRFLPGVEPREGRLVKAMHDRLAEMGEGPGGSEFPSALAFWGEIGKQMADPDAIGLTLESLDLAPDGGRISARVPAFKEDPLRNAAQLEALLNKSTKVTARGDYEVREGQVQVRLRMDYKP